MNYPRLRRIYLTMYNKRRLPRRATTILVKTFAFATDPLSWWRRRKAAASAIAVSAPLEVPAATGYLKFAPQDLPHTAAAIAECQAIFADKVDQGLRDRNSDNFSKPFLRPVTDKCSELLERDAIRRFALSPELISIVCRYLGSMPILSEVQLLWTPANDTLWKSQKFHLDAEDYRQLKLFLHVDDVDESCGPFTLISAPQTRRVCAATGYRGGRRSRLEDEAVRRVVDGDFEQAIGERGSGILVDTSRCLHYGSRGNQKQRLVLFLQFISYYAPKLEPFDWRTHLPRTDGFSPSERLLLRI